MFKAVRWDPTQWVNLFKDSGARYVVPVAEHHDGFPMYDCSFTNSNAVKHEPDIFWFDFYLDQPELCDARYRFAADYYNLSVDWGKDVVLQYKYDIYHPSIGVLDIERGKLSGIQCKPWQTHTSVSFRGRCSISDPDYQDSMLKRM